MLEAALACGALPLSLRSLPLVTRAGFDYQPVLLLFQGGSRKP
jgi:hypothetical protein